jgi:hypothetical protein
VIAEIPIPIPRDVKVIRSIGKKVITSIEALEQSLSSSNVAESQLMSLIGIV